MGFCMMFKTQIVAAMIGLALVVGQIAPAAAQASRTEMTEAEMIEALKKQKTRGLSIAPVGQGAPAQGTASTDTETTTVAGFAVLPKEEQVNINIRFDFDSAALRPDQKPKLAALCAAVTTTGVGTLRIVGHTDSSGSAAYNERLSLLRAEEVKSHLASECNIPADQMEAVGMGKRFLYDPADPRGEVNRRVEFQALS